MFATVLAAAATAAGQDELTINRVPLHNIRITGMNDCRIVYEQSGREISEQLADVDFIQLDREDEFNRAETLLAEGEIDEALKQYRRARLGSEREWVQELAELRRMQAMDADGRINEAVRMWLKALTDYNSSANAQALIPSVLAEPGDEANREAFDLLEAKRAETDPSEDLKLWKAIADLQLQIAELEGDTENTTRIAEEILQVMPTDGAGDEGVAPRLQSAAVFIEDPAKAPDVVEIVTGDLYLYGQRQLPQALLLLGKAQAMLAEADDQNRTLLIDAGNNLMHVVVFFADSDQAAEAYYQAAGVNNQLGNAEAARAAYQAVQTDYPDSPFAAKAGDALTAMETVDGE